MRRVLADDGYEEERRCKLPDVVRWDEIPAPLTLHCKGARWLHTPPPPLTFWIRADHTDLREDVTFHHWSLMEPQGHVAPHVPGLLGAKVWWHIETKK